MKISHLIWGIVVGLVIGTGIAVFINFSPPQQSTGTRSNIVYTLFRQASSSLDVAGIIDVKDYSSAVCSIDWDTNPTSTIKFVGSISDIAPNFLGAQSSTNQYEYLASTDLKSGSAVAGNTGYSASTTADHKLVYVDVKQMGWFSARYVTTTANVATTTPTVVKCVTSNVR